MGQLEELWLAFAQRVLAPLFALVAVLDLVWAAVSLAGPPEVSARMRGGGNGRQLAEAGWANGTVTHVEQRRLC